jgi:hypothetical protein
MRVKTWATNRPNKKLWCVCVFVFNKTKIVHYKTCLKGC